MAGKIADQYLHRTRFFAATRTPGKSSPKSGLIFIKAGPKFPHPTAQQQKVAAAGKACGAEIRGKFPGSGGVRGRRDAMRRCILGKFGKS